MNIEQYQSLIFELNCDFERMSVLERKSRARLQIVHRHNRCYIRSINDKYKDIRIILLGLIINIYQTNHLQRLQKLKHIIYSSELQHLTTSRGLLKEELHKNIGINLLVVKQGENIQNELIKCFNCVAFFDEVLVSSFREHFIPNDFQSFQRWQSVISKAFEIDIKIVEYHNPKQRSSQKINDQIQLQRGSDCIYFPSNHKQSFETDTLIDVSLNSLEEIEIEKRNNLMTVSIDSFDSPSPGLANKQNIDNQNILERNNRIPEFQVKAEIRKSRRTKNSSLWSFFCCSVD